MAEKKEIEMTAEATASAPAKRTRKKTAAAEAVEVKKGASHFEVLSAIDIRPYCRQLPDGLLYANWAKVWQMLKERYPDASWHIVKNEHPVPAYGDEVFVVGRSAEVKVSLTVDGEEIVETMAIMDQFNNPVEVSYVNSVNKNNAVRRCLAKAAAMHGLGISLYTGEIAGAEAAVDGTPTVEAPAPKPAKIAAAVEAVMKPAEKTEKKEEKKPEPVAEPQPAPQPEPAPTPEPAPAAPAVVSVPKETETNAADQVGDVVPEEAPVMSLDEALEMTATSGKLAGFKFRYCVEGRNGAGVKDMRASLRHLSTYANSGTLEEQAAATMIMNAIDNGVLKVVVKQ